MSFFVLCVVMVSWTLMCYRRSLNQVFCVNVVCSLFLILPAYRLRSLSLSLLLFAVVAIGFLLLLVLVWDSPRAPGTRIIVLRKTALTQAV